MAMKFLAKIKHPGPEQSVKFLLHQYLNDSEPERTMATVHASELTKPDGFCPRAYALSDVTHQKPGVRWLSTSENMTFALGRAVEKKVVETFADMGKAICHWECLACKHLHQFTSRPFGCQKCSCKAFKPVEVRFQSAVNGASCGIDMLVTLGEGKLRPVELKTMAADEFKSLQAPLAEHRLRTNLYLRLIAESDHNWSNMVATDRALILYISKSAYGCADPSLAAWGLKEKFSPFKEFEVTRDDKETDYLANRAIVVKSFRDGVIGVPAGICPTAMTKRACSCALRIPCFSGAHPATYEWAQ
jgi:hypothetical protein